MIRTEEHLQKYGAVETRQPILFGHIFKKFSEKSMRDTLKWALSENAKIAFPDITLQRIMNLRTIYSSKYHGRNLIKF